jgi:OOP family OmpA-OmpF porin
MPKPDLILKASLLSVALSGAPFAMAGSPKIFGPVYTPVAAVSAGQAQIVYYRPPAVGTRPGAAQVYVDREFYSGLLPGGYTTFCVAAGPHILSVYLDDVSHSQGKTTDLRPALLEGGKTYFLRVSESDNSVPQVISRDDAEQELIGARRRVQELSRVSSVETCN